MYKRCCLIITLTGYLIATSPTYADGESRKIVLLPSPFGTLELKQPVDENMTPTRPDRTSSHGDDDTTNPGTAAEANTPTPPQGLTTMDSADELSPTSTAKARESVATAEPSIQPTIKITTDELTQAPPTRSVATPLDFNLDVPKQTNHDLNQQLTSLKREVIGISQAIESLEESLMTSHDNQLNGYLSVEETPGFTLESLSLTLNDKIINQHFYNPREMNALQRGAVQRLFNTAIINGEHELVATIQGTLNEKPYKRDLVITFKKGSSTQYVQLDIKNQAFTKEPAFQFRAWE